MNKEKQPRKSLINIKPMKWNLRVKEGKLAIGWKKLLEDVFAPDKGVIARVVKRAIAGKEGFKVEYRVPDENGGWRWMYAKGAVESQRVKAVIEDVTERKKREREIKLSERKFRSVFDTVPEAMAIIDNDLKVIDVNPAAVKSLGKSKNWLRNKPLIQLMGEENRDTLLKSWNNFLKGRLRKGRIEIRDEGKLRIIEYDIVPHDLANSNLVVWRDVTDVVMEEKRKEHFLTIAGHELRSPLTGAKIFVQTLRQYPDLKKGKKGEYLKKTEEKLNLLAELINDLLDVTRFREGKLEFVTEEFYFDKLVNKVLEEFKVINQTHQIVSEGDAAVKINGDQKRITQVITNLLRNAVKYSPEGSKVIVKTWQTANGVVLAVQDFGVGIPKEDQKKIFDLYYRSNGPGREGIKGLGVGLYICAEIVKHHGGKMSVKSQENEGSTFMVELPGKPDKPMKLARKLVLQPRRV